MKLIRTTEERNQHWLNLGFKNLLIWLLIYVMVGLFLEATSYAKPILSIFLTLVLMSTLGYGDITPQTRGASALCQAQAIVGQFFTMVVVARLVGIQVAQQTAPEEEA